MMTPLFTPLKGEGAEPCPPLPPLEPGGERAAAGERGSPVAPPPASGPRAVVEPLEPLLLWRPAPLPFSPPPPPGLPVFGGGLAARTGTEDAGRLFSLSLPRGGGEGAIGDNEGGVAAEEEGCQRS